MGRFPIGPLAWIILTPLATVPATAAVTAALTPAFSQSYPSLEALEAAAAANPYCTVHISIGAEAILGIVAANAVCPDGYVLAALSPGLLNLVPLLWLLSRRVEIRRAAIIASILGGLRFVIPSLAVLTLAGGASGAAHKACAEACAKAGEPLAILTGDGEVYMAVSSKAGDPQNPRLLPFVEGKVKVTGTHRMNHGVHTIEIKTVAAAT